MFSNPRVEGAFIQENLTRIKGLSKVALAEMILFSVVYIGFSITQFNTTDKDNEVWNSIIAASISLILFLVYYCLAWYRYNSLFAYFSFFLSGVIAISAAEKGGHDI